MTKLKKKLLIFSAHPDDHISCAGFAMYLKDIGFEIFETVFTGGGKGVCKNTPDGKVVTANELITIRKTEFAKASKILGTTSFQFLGIENNNVRRTSELIDKLVQIIRDVKPTLIITENPNDYHFDHREIGNIVTEATDRAGWGVSKELGKPFKTLVLLYMGSLPENERTDILIDITRYQNKKMNMLKVYGSQMGDSSFQLAEALDSYRGYQLRTRYAEAYQIGKNYPVRLNSLLEILDHGKSN